MLSISGTDISLTRGDSAFIEIGMTKNGQPYTPLEGEEVRFAMKKNYNDDEPLLVKVIPNETLVLHLLPEDTKEFPMGKTYVYDIEFTDVNGEVDTFIEGTLNLLKEVL